MTMKFTKINFGTGTAEILQHPDHYVAYAQVLPQNSPLAVTVGSRKIVKAGTVYPANDETAVGLVFADYDVTEGDANAAILVHAFVNTAKLPAAPTAKAIVSLKQITFYPVAPYVPAPVTP